MDNHSIGKTIAFLRKQKGWTQVELAQKLDVSDKTISKWESEIGYPEISQFPAMAKLFGVSIDYLMTGVTPAEKVVTMSRLELCAKNDDVELLKELNHWTDDSGCTLADYILKYESLNVYNEVANEYEIYSKIKPLQRIKFALLSNNISLLENIQPDASPSSRYSIFDCIHVQDEKKYRCGVRCRPILTDDIFKLIVCDERISKSTFNYLLSIDQIHSTCNWYRCIPYLIHYSYISGKIDKLEKLLQLTNENHKIAIENQSNGYRASDHVLISKIRAKDYYFGVILVREETIKVALKKGDFDAVATFNKINTHKLNINTPYFASDYEIKMARLKLDKTITEKEYKKQSVIHDDCVNIDELIALDDYDLYCELLNTEKNFSKPKDSISFSQIIDLTDVRFFEKACKIDASNQDWALMEIVKKYPERYKIQKVLLDNGAKIHKTWVEDDGWGYMVNRDCIDEIATNLLKNQIKLLIG